MFRILGLTAALACLATTALAGPNAGGVLIVATNGTVYCADNAPYCAAPISDCESGVVRADGAQVEAIVLNVIAAFDAAANPRLAGVTFGLNYDEGQIFLSGSGACGDFELADANWPESGAGTAVTWNSAQTSSLVDVYWIAAYNYYGNPNTLDLIPHPTQGGSFADDSVPSDLDEIAAFGAFGFDTAGTLTCPEAGDTQGACCSEEGLCELVQEADCQGEYLGNGTLCEPNPCPQPPVGACCIAGICSVMGEDDCAAAGGIYIGDDTICESDFCTDPIVESSWGLIKSTFR